MIAGMIVERRRMIVVAYLRTRLVASRRTVGKTFEPWMIVGRRPAVALLAVVAVVRIAVVAALATAVVVEPAALVALVVAVSFAGRVQIYFCAVCARSDFSSPA